MDHDFAELLEASSLGTPAARLIRSTADLEAVDEVHRRMADSAQQRSEGDDNIDGEPDLSVVATSQRKAHVSAPDDSQRPRNSAILCGVGVLTPCGVIDAGLKDQLRAAHPGYNSVFKDGLGLMWGQVDDVDDALDSIRLLRWLTEAYDSARASNMPRIMVCIDMGASYSAFSSDGRDRNSACHDLFRSCQNELMALNGSNDHPGRDIDEATVTSFASFYRSSYRELRKLLLMQPEDSHEGQLNKVGSGVWLFSRNQTEDHPSLSDLLLQDLPPQRLPRMMHRLWRIAAMSSEDAVVKKLAQYIVVSSAAANRPDLVAELVGRRRRGERELSEACLTVIQEMTNTLGADYVAPKTSRSTFDQFYALSRSDYKKELFKFSTRSTSRGNPQSLSQPETPCELLRVRGHIQWLNRPNQSGSRPAAGFASRSDGGLGDASGADRLGDRSVNRFGGMGGVAFPGGQMSAIGRLPSSGANQERQRITWLSEDDDCSGIGGDDTVPPVVG
ncbi:hypothetical protein [Actinoallomurus oryzae]|uniref:hypothetical protein n=1 Tax=Actinoallomurus oryzae TaxID=502180 RepID=UPI0031E9EF99